MRVKLAVLTGIFSAVSPLLAIMVMCSVEQELIEAILSGWIIGCAIGTVFGIVSLILNRGESRLAKVLAVIPICAAAACLILLIPALLYQ